MPDPATRLRSEAEPSDRRAAAGQPAALQEYLKCGYSALSHAIVDYWMPKLSGAAFKLLVFLLRATVGDRAKRLSSDMAIAISLDGISQQTGIDRESAIKAVRELEGAAIVSAKRAHRQTTVYALELPSLLDPWIGKTDSTDAFRVGDPDSNKPLRSEIPTQNRPFESVKPTPYKEINKAAAAIPIRQPNPTDGLTAVESLEIARISESTGIRIDGKDALRLSADLRGAGFTLSHLRWFLADEKFAGARSPRAVLFSIAREFAQRAVGMKWPASLEPVARRMPHGMTREELLNL